jgi:periplasmic protein TonB
MKRLLICSFLMMICFCANAQNKEDGFICYFEPNLEFKGGMKALQNFLERNLKYPNNDVCVNGKVYIQFVVEKNGKITHPIILKSLSKEYDAEALRVVKLMPRWIPARDWSSKKPLKSKFTIPIKFEIEDCGKLYGVRICPVVVTPATGKEGNAQFEIFLRICCIFYTNSAITVSPPTGVSFKFTKILASKGKKISTLEPNLMKPNSFPCSTIVPLSTYQQILRAIAPAI